MGCHGRNGLAGFGEKVSRARGELRPRVATRPAVGGAALDGEDAGKANEDSGEDGKANDADVESGGDSLSEDNDNAFLAHPDPSGELESRVNHFIQWLKKQKAGLGDPTYISHFYNQHRHDPNTHHLIFSGKLRTLLLQFPALRAFG